MDFGRFGHGVGQTTWPAPGTLWFIRSSWRTSRFRYAWLF
jgi:hypothetical protein